MNELLTWLYQQLVGLLTDLFAAMGGMGVELFRMSWVQAVLTFFQRLAWALYGTGLVVALFECGIEYTNGRANVKGVAINTLKGFLAASLFTTLPVELYALSVDLQGSLSHALSGAGGGVGELAGSIIRSILSSEKIYALKLRICFGSERRGTLYAVKPFRITKSRKPLIALASL